MSEKTEELDLKRVLAQLTTLTAKVDALESKQDKSFTESRQATIDAMKAEIDELKTLAKRGKKDATDDEQSAINYFLFGSDTDDPGDGNDQ